MRVACGVDFWCVGVHVACNSSDATPTVRNLVYMDAEKMETLTGQLGQTGSQPATRGYNTTEPARVAGEGNAVLYLTS